MAQKFQHRAGAYGIGGKFLWPISAPIHIRPSVDLTPDGGFGRDTEENYNFHDLVSFRRAYTEVSGSPNDERREGKTMPAHNNLSLSVIENFNLLNVIEVDKIVSRITTRYFEGDKEIEIVLTGTRFQGFRILGYEVIVELATEVFYQNPTFSRLKKTYTDDQTFRDRYHLLSRGTAVPDPPCPEVELTLVERIIVPRPTTEFTVKGNEIDIPHVGRLFLAELNVSAGLKTLNMIRWELGCPSGGSGNIGGGEGGGTIP